MKHIAALAGIIATCTVCTTPVKTTPMLARTSTFSPFAKSDIEFMYSTVSRKEGLEFARCMYGKQSNDTAYIDRLESAFTVYATSDSILFYCDENKADYLGGMHSHPPRDYDNCVGSAMDYVSFLRDKKNKFMVVVCNEHETLTVPRPPSPKDDSLLAYVRTLPPHAAVILK